MTSLSNENLLLSLKNLVTEERQLTTRILEYLREVEKRKLFLIMGYPNLFEFCVRELGYAEGSAHRRITAMRLIKDVPEIEAKIATGEISLTVAAQAQSFFQRKKRKNEDYSKTQKLNLLTQLENVSTRECEKTLLQIDPEPVRKDCARAITAELTELRLTVDVEFMQKIEKLKNLFSHVNAKLTTQEALAMALDHLLEKKDPTHAKTRSTPRLQTTTHSLPAPEVKTPARSRCTPARSRYIPQTVRREVWRKHHGQCAYMDPLSGRRCTSQKFLHYDHIQPFAYGGAHSTSNLQLLCANHNLLKGGSG